MSLEQYEPLLESCAETGEIDYDQWPLILPPLADRIVYIANNEFPIPRLPPILNPILPSQRPNEPFIDNPPILPSNTPSTPRILPPVPPFPGSSNTTHVSNSQDTNEPQSKLPLEVIQLLNQSLHTLRSTFPEKPPHTVQRLCELVLYPTKHYRTLPSWLRALDRTVSVTSGAEIFPLSDQPPNLGLATNGILNDDSSGILFGSSSNDTRNGYDRDSLGSDESLGGALLTPIPWLRDSDMSSSASTFSNTSKVESWQETTEGAEQPEDGMLAEDNLAATAAHAEALAAVQENSNDVPARDGSAVTQGELIRLEQEAGIVPVPHDDPPRLGDQGIELDDDEGLPHARGPDLVGTVDMGLVEGKERQLRISSPPSEDKIDVNDAQEVLSGGSKDEDKSSGDEFVKVEKDEVSPSKTDDGDIVLVDAEIGHDSEDNKDGRKKD